MRFRIEFSAEAERDFSLIFDHLFESYRSFGESVEAALDHCEDRIRDIRQEADRLGEAPYRGERHDDLRPGRIHPVKAAATSDLTVAFHGDDLEKVFDAERGEGEHLDLGGAVDPNYAVFGLHADGEIMKPIDGFAQLGGDTTDGLDGMDLV